MILRDCLLLADDFTQYWMGAYDRTAFAAEGVLGTAEPLDGFQALFGGAATADNPIDEVGAFTPTSEILPIDQFPQFTSWAAADYTDVSGRFFAVEGDVAAAATHVDDGYQRIGRTFDLTSLDRRRQTYLPSADRLRNRSGLRPRHRGSAHRGPGRLDDTPRPERQDNDSGSRRVRGGLLPGHPSVLGELHHARRPVPADGVIGDWNAFTGSSDGWIPVAFDLSAYAGSEVEVVVSYVTDPATGETGLIVDDTRLVVAGQPTQADGFEEGFVNWTVLGPPVGSPDNASDFELADGLGEVVAVTATPDTLLFGFGLEQLEPDARNDVVARMLAHFAG